MVTDYSSSIQEAEAGGAWIQGWPGLCSDTMSQKQKQNKKLQKLDILESLHKLMFYLVLLDIFKQFLISNRK
jgi:hypothetical protein